MGVKKAEGEFGERCMESGVPEDDSTWTSHINDLRRTLEDKGKIIEQDNEKRILEFISSQEHTFQEKLREGVDALINQKDIANADLAASIPSPDELAEAMAVEYAKASVSAQMRW